MATPFQQAVSEFEEAASKAALHASVGERGEVHARIAQARADMARAHALRDASKTVADAIVALARAVSQRG